MYKDTSQYRWFMAYKAYRHAKNDKFKAYWLKVMEHFKKDFH